jgi:hypothetical protein
MKIKMPNLTFEQAGQLRTKRMLLDAIADWPDEAPVYLVGAYGKVQLWFDVQDDVDPDPSVSPEIPEALLLRVRPAGEGK